MPARGDFRLDKMRARGCFLVFSERKHARSERSRGEIMRARAVFGSFSGFKHPEYLLGRKIRAHTENLRAHRIFKTKT